MTATRRDSAPAGIEELRDLIGRTPLIEIRCRYQGRAISVWGKLESTNLTGSIKDRMAVHILEHAYDRGIIEPGDVIAEATSGNTGISFAALGRALGHPVRIFMPDWMSLERVQIIQSLGATIIPVSREDGGFLGSIDRATAFAESMGSVFLPHQFDNRANIEAHYRGTGPEIVAQMAERGATPSAFVAGVGTGGTVMGVGRFFRERLGKSVAIHPLEPANSPTMRTGRKVGKHRIQGISDEFVPSVLDLEWLDEIIDVVRDAELTPDLILGIRSALEAEGIEFDELGLPIGISSGANLIGALLVGSEMGDGAQVATVFPDSHKKYLSTDYCSEEECKDHYVSGKVDLLGFGVQRMG